jgi:hypothetical protein
MVARGSNGLRFDQNIFALPFRRCPTPRDSRGGLLDGRLWREYATSRKIVSEAIGAVGMEMAGRLVLTFLLVAFGSLLSRSLFPPGKLLRQIFVAVLWFCIGAAALHIWTH